MTAPPAPALPKPRRRWGLLTFWIVILAGAGAGAAYLQYLGPPPSVSAGVAPAAPVPAAPPPAVTPASEEAADQPQDPAMAPEIDVAGTLGSPSTLTPGAPIPPPDAKLLAPSPINRQWQVPQIAPNGATPMQAYAASQLPPPDAALLPPDVPRVALIVAGLGDDLALTEDAVSLPPEISLALSPYGKTVAQAAAAARATGHETLLLLPMPGLLAGAPQTQNQATLDWSMAQIQGYAGVTDAFGPAMGGGFMASPAARNWLLMNIARRGMFYIEGDPNAGAAPFAAGRNADIVIDASDGPADEAVKLAALVTDAESQHSALGIMLNPTPQALRDLAGWSDTLLNEDVLLVPVSALVQPPDIPVPIDASLK